MDDTGRRRYLGGWAEDQGLVTDPTGSLGLLGSGQTSHDRQRLCTEQGAVGLIDCVVSNGISILGSPKR